jgi:prolyl-tRNA synthetase
MKMSQQIVKPLKDAPRDADTANHRLLVQAGFVRQLMAGVYTYLPLGLKVLDKISEVVREEMDLIGGQEVLMPMLHPAENWKKTGGWENIDVLFKVKSRTERDYALGQSQEEVVTPLMKEFINSYRDLPASVYHIQWKFRDELRSKSGILRGREFLMKDMYSWHENEKDFEEYYKKVKQAYIKVFKRLGLVAKVTEASGGSFTDKVSYEFMILTNAGEDDILYCPVCEFCVNTEIAKSKMGDECPGCRQEKLLKDRASEVGNVFDLGRKYAKDFDLQYTDKEGKRKHPVMGCYGIGVSRTMGALVEKFNDDKGILWPEIVAPFRVHLISLGDDTLEAKKLYQELTKTTEVLWDDREVSAGMKFADADLIGCPLRVVISEKSLKSGGVEIKERNEETTKIVTKEELLKILNA